VSEYFVIDLIPTGEASVTVNFPLVTLTFITRYNYSAECWSMDILDTDGNLILAGLMLLPGFNLIEQFPAQQEAIGSLIVSELNIEDYKQPYNLGSSVVLLWEPPV
jgi:hypothetical protein